MHAQRYTMATIACALFEQRLSCGILWVCVNDFKAGLWRGIRVPTWSCIRLTPDKGASWCWSPTPDFAMKVSRGGAACTLPHALVDPDSRPAMFKFWMHTYRDIPVPMHMCKLRAPVRVVWRHLHVHMATAWARLSADQSMAPAAAWPHPFKGLGHGHDEIALTDKADVYAVLTWACSNLAPLERGVQLECCSCMTSFMRSRPSSMCPIATWDRDTEVLQLVRIHEPSSHPCGKLELELSTWIHDRTCVRHPVLRNSWRAGSPGAS